ncbi:protein of unknown function [Nitrospira japonica]|uniref:Phage integrase n=1 Tax=Nitrospira japonica TaxID=1325564 RepID=A0A1W1I5C9_9BACT|nr:protein of unknown function [Nitrospira japonica]
MACVRKRRGKYVVDWRDGAGVRHWKTFDRKVDAEAHRDKVGPEARQRVTPAVPATITLSEYATHWKRLIGQAVKARTLARYSEILTLHLLPRFEKVRVRDLDRGRIKILLAEKLESGLERRTVRNIHATLRTLLNAAIEDGVIVANPAARLGRTLKLTVAKSTIQEEIKAMTKAQRLQFLATAQKVAPRYYPLFFILAGTGMRLGEALALQWSDLDRGAKTIRIARAFAEDGTLDTPKSGHGRTVDLSQALTDALVTHEEQHRRDHLRYEWTECPPWLVVTKAGTPVDPANVRRTMARVLTSAMLPTHFTPHCLRHTYASILLADGVSPAYVQEQLGHATIELTVSTYGRWLKKKAPGVLDQLDAVVKEQTHAVAVSEPGSKVVAETQSAVTVASTPMDQRAYIEGFMLEPATRIERATCGLRNRCSTN